MTQTTQAQIDQAIKQARIERAIIGIRAIRNAITTAARWIIAQTATAMRPTQKHHA